MLAIYVLLLFFLVLFVYTHVYFQLKTSSEIKVYELETPVTGRIDDVLNLKQPVVFTPVLPYYFPNNDTVSIAGLTQAEIKEIVKDNSVKITNNTVQTSTRTFSSMDSAFKLFRADTEKKYYTDHNYDILSNKVPKNYLENLKPPFCSHVRHDVLFGSADATSRLQYKINFRTFFLVTSGEIRMRLMPPNRLKSNGLSSNYYSFEFSSNRDIWNLVDDNICKVKLGTGQCIYIPPYWQYSIQFAKDAVVVETNYNSAMTEVATVNHHALFWTYKLFKPVFVPGKEHVVADDSSEEVTSGDTLVETEESGDSKESKESKESKKSETSTIPETGSELKSTLVDGTSDPDSEEKSVIKSKSSGIQTTVIEGSSKLKKSFEQIQAPPTDID